MDPQQRQIIEQLIPVYREPDFDDLLQQLTQDQSPGTRLLLKMELNRLMRPCRRAIDLRPQSGHACQRVELHGLVHYLTPDAVAIYKDLLQYYGGQYTTGVFEGLKQAHNDALARHQSDAAMRPARQYEKPAQIIPLGQHVSRQEKRLQLVLPITLFCNGEAHATQTSDLSVSGLRVLLPLTCALTPGDTVGIRFGGITEPSFEALAGATLTYEALAIDRGSQQQWVRLKLQDGHPQWSHYLQFVAQSMRGRYKLNVDDVLEQVRIKGYEQYFLSRLSGLPLFFSEPGALRLSHVLLNENNQPLAGFWQDSDQQLVLRDLLHAPGVRLSLPPGAGVITVLLYCFSIEAGGKTHYYVASDTTLSSSGLKAHFTAFGSRRGSWRVFQLTVKSLSPAQSRELTDCWDPLMLDPDSRRQLSRLCAIGMLHDLTTKGNTAGYQSTPLPGGDLNALKQFQLPPTEGTGTQAATLQYMQLRQEDRFSYRAKVTLHHDGQAWPATTRDFSINGLSLELEQPLALLPGETIPITLDQLQPLSPRHRLQQLPYQVVGHRGEHTVVHLRADNTTSSHPGCDFFRKLIEANRDKLRLNAGRKAIPGLALALRNIFLLHSFGCTLFIHRHQTRLQLDTVARTTTPGRLAGLFEAFAQAGNWSLYPLQHNQLAKKVMLSPLRQLKREHRPRTIELYLQLMRASQRDMAPLVSYRLSHEFYSENERRRFITQALQGGRFYSIQVVLSRAGELDMQFIAKEIELVSRHAIHRGRTIAEELEQVVGVAELVDTTRETLFRLGFADGAGPAAQAG